MSVLKEIEELKANLEDEDSIQTVKEWEIQLRKSMILARLEKNPAMKMIAEECTRRVNECNEQLLNNRTLTDVQRLALFEKKDSYNWFLHIFDMAKATVEEVSRAVKHELE